MILHAQSLVLIPQKSFYQSVTENKCI